MMASEPASGFRPCASLKLTAIDPAIVSDEEFPSHATDQRFRALVWHVLAAPYPR
jgi:hypothetical protein